MTDHADLADPAGLAAHVAAAQDGDPEAFNQLVRATYAATYSLAYQLTGNADDANDVAQDTYLRAFRGLRRFRGEAAFPTWLYRITVNSAHNLRAKRRRPGDVSLDDHRSSLHVVDANPESDPLARAVATDLKDRVRHSLAGLPALARQVLVLREVEGLTHSAIAERLGISETAAKVRLHRARQRLRAALNDDALHDDALHEDAPNEDALNGGALNGGALNVGALNGDALQGEARRDTKRNGKLADPERTSAA